MITPKHKRIFCFGCSFTQWKYMPTWADILKYYYKDTKTVYNFGRGGAGNYFIFNNIVEKSLEYNFTKDDLILIQWSGVLREDRFKDGEWWTPGNILNQDTYSKPIVKFLFDEEGMMKRDYSYVHAMQKILEVDNIDYEMFSMNGVSRYNPTSPKKEEKNRESEEIDFLIELYKDTLDELHPSMYKIIFGDETIYPPNREDPHPTPVEHLYYLEKVFNFKPSDELRTHTEIISKDIDYPYLNSLYLKQDLQEFFMKLKSKYYDNT